MEHLNESIDHESENMGSSRRISRQRIKYSPAPEILKRKQPTTLKKQNQQKRKHDAKPFDSMSFRRSASTLSRENSFIPISYGKNQMTQVELREQLEKLPQTDFHVPEYSELRIEIENGTSSITKI